MARRRSLAILGVLTFLVGALIMFPARVAWNWFGKPSTGSSYAQMSGISGSVWAGDARELAVMGLYFRDVRWRVKPLRLFTGRLALSLEATPSSGFVESDLHVTLGGDLSLTNLTASMALAPLEQVLRAPGLRGAASLEFERITLADGIPIAADGVVTVADFAASKISRAPLGGYKAEFFTQNNGISASVEDTDGVVDLAGALQVSPDGEWEFTGQVAAKGETPQDLRQYMTRLGNPDARGMRQLNLAGKL